MKSRGTKFYRKNEEEVMKALGFKPTKNSGAGFAEKEDGQNDYLICQLKSTDAKSISVKLQDIHTLEYNAIVSHKLPVFAIQFLSTGEVWLMAKPTDFVEVSKYISTGVCNVSGELLDGERIDTSAKAKKPVRSSESSREAFNNETKKKYEKENKAW